MLRHHVEEPRERQRVCVCVRHVRVRAKERREGWSRCIIDTTFIRPTGEEEENVHSSCFCFCSCSCRKYPLIRSTSSLVQSWEQIHTQCDVCVHVGDSLCHWDFLCSHCLVWISLLTHIFLPKMRRRDAIRHDTCLHAMQTRYFRCGATRLP